LSLDLEEYIDLLDLIKMNKFLKLIVVVALSNCTGSTSHGQTEAFSRFDANFVSHFPDPDNTLSLVKYVEFFPTRNWPNRGAYIRYTYKIDKGDFDVLTNSVELSSLQSTKQSNSDCVPCVEAKNSAYQSTCSVFKYPIPTFQEERRFFNIEGNYLPDDFTIYVIDAEPGIFLPEKNLIKTPCEDEKWNHGYSRGIAVSKERGIAIFWLEIW